MKASQSFSSVDDGKSVGLYLSDIGHTTPLSSEREAELARRIREGDQDAMDELCQANLKFVVSVAKQYSNRGLSLGDLINEGNLGLMKAAQRFDEKRGFRFISYAVWWIRQRILQAIAEQGSVVRVPTSRTVRQDRISRATSELVNRLGREPTVDEIADQMSLEPEQVEQALSSSRPVLSLDSPVDSDEEMILSDFIADEDVVAPDSDFFEGQLRKDLLEVMATLTPKESDVLCQYFGLHGGDGATLEEIGKSMGLTRERVRQIKGKAMRKLRHSSRSKVLQSYLN
jgi:RNA polymerase primary sigma factor